MKEKLLATECAIPTVRPHPNMVSFRILLPEIVSTLGAPVKLTAYKFRPAELYNLQSLKVLFRTFNIPVTADCIPTLFTPENWVAMLLPVILALAPKAASAKIETPPPNDVKVATAEAFEAVPLLAMLLMVLLAMFTLCCSSA